MAGRKGVIDVDDDENENEHEEEEAEEGEFELREDSPNFNVYDDGFAQDQEQDFGPPPVVTPAKRRRSTEGEQGNGGKRRRKVCVLCMMPCTRRTDSLLSGGRRNTRRGSSAAEGQIPGCVNHRLGYTKRHRRRRVRGSTLTHSRVLTIHLQFRTDFWPFSAPQEEEESQSSLRRASAHARVSSTTISARTFTHDFASDASQLACQTTNGSFQARRRRGS